MYALICFHAAVLRPDYLGVCIPCKGSSQSSDCTKSVDTQAMVSLAFVRPCTMLGCSRCMSLVPCKGGSLCSDCKTFCGWEFEDCGLCGPGTPALHLGHLRLVFLIPGRSVCKACCGALCCTGKGLGYWASSSHGSMRRAPASPAAPAAAESRALSTPDGGCVNNYHPAEYWLHVGID